MPLMNSPGYYYNSALDTFDQWQDQRYHNDNLRAELYMWLFLYVMSQDPEEDGR